MSQIVHSPAHQHRWLRAIGIVVVFGTLGLAGLIAVGVFDPQSAGSVAVSIVPGEVTVGADDEIVVWQPDTTNAPAVAQTWRLSAAHSHGELDMGYGLVIGNDNRALVVAVSPLGYAAVWERNAAGDRSPVWFPWQVWPHVAAGDAANEIWVDVTPQEGQDVVTVRIDRELLWAGQVAPLSDRVGLWAGSFGDEATVDFQQLFQFDASLTEQE